MSVDILSFEYPASAWARDGRYAGRVRSTLTLSIVALALLLSACSRETKLTGRPGVPTSIATAAPNARGVTIADEHPEPQEQAPPPRSRDVLMPDDPFGLPPGVTPPAGTAMHKGSGTHL